MSPTELAAASLAATVLLGGCALAAQHAPTPNRPAARPAPVVSDDIPAPTPTPSAAVVAFCGPTTANPHWRAQLAALADIGVTAIHGPCRTPTGYTVQHPGDRYAPQAEYLELAGEARRHGLGVIAYDPTFWTDPPAAAATWAEFIADGTLVAVDLGDEPDFADMAELYRRAELVRTVGVEPQVIFFPGYFRPLADSYSRLPTACPISDDYEDSARALADAALLRSLAGCSGLAIDSTGRDLDGDGDRWSVDLTRIAVADGYRITLFTGVRPENYPDWDALVDDHGHITEAGRAVQNALASHPGDLR